MASVVGTSPLVHALHDLIVLGGLWGLAVLLLPHLLGRHLDRLGIGAAAPRDDHEARVALLRAAAQTGRLGSPETVATTSARVAVVRPPTATTHALDLPLAVVATAAAAGIHAALAPHHARESALFGLFFAATATAQALWAVQAQTRPTRALLAWGVVGNAAVVVLWLATRTVGLPWGLLPQPEAVGSWDVVCVAWQLVAVVVCVRLLRAGRVPGHGTGWDDWHPSSRAALGGAAVLLALLVLMGSHG